MSSNHEVTFESLLTDDVYQAALRYAERFSKRMGVLFEPEDLVHEGLRAIAARYEGSYDSITNLGSLLSLEIYSRYVNWLTWDGQKWHRAARSLTEYEAPAHGEDRMARAIPPEMWVLQETDRTILQHDVENAIAKLSPEDQRLVRAYMASESGSVAGALSGREAARKLGIWNMEVSRRLPGVLAQLREHLADYAPPQRDKRQTGSRQDDVA
jgi:RNA polymerase sigma factor (sigma-70 family)